MIEKVFEDLQPYLKVVKRDSTYRIIEVHFKKTWTVPEHETILTQKKELKEPDKLYYMFYSNKDSFDTIIDWVKKEVVEFNLITEEKELLLRQKVAELKQVFESSSLDDLKNLKFSSETDELKLTGKPKVEVEKPEVVNSENK